MRNALSTLVIIAAVAAWLASSFLWAQSTRLHGGGGWFWVQYGGLMGLDRLANALKAQGLSYQAPGACVGIGGGGGGYLGRFHIGGEGGTFFGQKVSGGGGWARIGYFFPLGGGLLIMPVAMVGGGGLDFQIREDASPVPFDQVATTTTYLSWMGTGGALVGGAIEVQKNFGGFLMGISAGYVAGPGWKDWEGLDGRRISGGPQVSFGMPYLRLQIGGGGWTSPQKN